MMKADKIPVSKAMSVARPSHTLATPSFDFAAPNAASSFNIPRIHYSLDNVQLSAADVDTGLSTEQVGEIAANGINGTPMPLPYFNRVQQAFGKHDISHVQAYADGKAAQAAKSIGAEAYASGDKIAFANANPSLHTVAHEAAHIIQQQAGVHLKGGVGQEGDRYEQHADAVADAVVTGKSVEGLLNGFSSNSKKSLRSGEVQRKLTIASVVTKTSKAAQKTIDDIDEFKEVEIVGKPIEDYLESKGLSGAAKEHLDTYIQELIDDEFHTHKFLDKKSNQDGKGAANKLKNYLEARAYENELTESQADEDFWLLFAIFLDDYIGKSIMDENATHLITSSIPTDGLAKYQHFLPRTPTKIKNSDEYEQQPELEHIKTNLAKIKSNTALAVTGEGFGAKTVTGKSMRTKVNWKGAEGVLGRGMTAEQLGPDHTLGSIPASKGDHAEARKALTTISGEKYIAGHLLNEQLGGPGNDVRNLAPIPDYMNKVHERKVESEVKYLVNRLHVWVWYEVKAPIKKMNSSKYKNLLTALSANKTEIENAYKKVDGKYTSAFEMEWGLLDENAEQIDETKRTLSLEFPDPVELRQYKNSDLNIGAPLGNKHIQDLAEQVKLVNASTTKNSKQDLLEAIAELEEIDLIAFLHVVTPQDIDKLTDKLSKGDITAKLSGFKLMRFVEASIQLKTKQIKYATEFKTEIAAEGGIDDEITDITKASKAVSKKPKLKELLEKVVAKPLLLNKSQREKVKDLTKILNKTELLEVFKVEDEDPTEEQAQLLMRMVPAEHLYKEKISNLLTHRHKLQLFTPIEIDKNYKKSINSITTEGLYGNDSEHTPRDEDEELIDDDKRLTSQYIQQLMDDDIEVARTSVKFGELIFTKLERTKAEIGALPTILREVKSLKNQIKLNNNNLKKLLKLFTTLTTELDEVFDEWLATEEVDETLSKGKSKLYDYIYGDEIGDKNVSVEERVEELTHIEDKTIDRLFSLLEASLEVEIEEMLDAYKFKQELLNEMLRRYLTVYKEQLLGKQKYEWKEEFSIVMREELVSAVQEKTSLESELTTTKLAMSYVFEIMKICLNEPMDMDSLKETMRKCYKENKAALELAIKNKGFDFKKTVLLSIFNSISNEMEDD